MGVSRVRLVRERNLLKRRRKEGSEETARVEGVVFREGRRGSSLFPGEVREVSHSLPRASASFSPSHLFEAPVRGRFDVAGELLECEPGLLSVYPERNEVGSAHGGVKSRTTIRHRRLGRRMPCLGRLRGSLDSVALDLP